MQLPHYLSERLRTLSAPLPRDHMLTFRDITPLWGGISPLLPTEIVAGGLRHLRLVTGPVPLESRLTLHIGITGGVLPKNVFVNSRPCTYRENARCVPRFTEDPVLCFDVPAYPERDSPGRTFRSRSGSRLAGCVFSRNCGC